LKKRKSNLFTEQRNDFPWANWGIRQEIDFRQGNSNGIAGSVN